MDSSLLDYKHWDTWPVQCKISQKFSNYLFFYSFFKASLPSALTFEASIRLFLFLLEMLYITVKVKTVAIWTMYNSDHIILKDKFELIWISQYVNTNDIRKKRKRKRKMTYWEKLKNNCHLLQAQLKALGTITNWNNTLH